MDLSMLFNKICRYTGNMKYVFALSLVLASCLAFHINIDESEYINRSFIDPIIKAILEGVRPKLANLTIPDINERINENQVNANISITKIELKNVDKFVIRVLKSDLYPLRLANLSLYWKDICFSALYDVKIRVKPNNNTSPINLFGDGKVKSKISDLYLTVGANLEMKKNALQIKPKGLFGFDIGISKADVSVSSLMNSTELGSIVGKFISRNLPGLIDDVKKPLFNAFHDDIVNFLNNVLKNNGTKYDDEMPQEDSQLFMDLFDVPHQLIDSEESLENEN